MLPKHRSKREDVKRQQDGSSTLSSPSTLKAVLVPSAHLDWSCGSLCLHKDARDLLATSQNAADFQPRNGEFSRPSQAHPSRYDLLRDISQERALQQGTTFKVRFRCLKYQCLSTSNHIDAPKHKTPLGSSYTCNRLTEKRNQRKKRKGLYFNDFIWQINESTQKTGEKVFPVNPYAHKR